jgi:hypothetical protein
MRAARPSWSGCSDSFAPSNKADSCCCADWNAAQAEWRLHCACHNLLKLFLNGRTARLVLA